MANIRISELPESQTFTANDIIPIVSDGSTKRISGLTLSDSISNDTIDTIVDEYINDINTTITALNTRVNNLITTGNGYIKFGSIGICWGSVNPSYLGTNVLQGQATLPLSFTNGKAIATPVNYNNIPYELDSIAKVPLNINGNTITLYLHSKSGAYTSGSTAFNINYIVIGQVSN